MAWVLYHLANNPAVLAELRQEIDGVPRAHVSLATLHMIQLSKH
jgi:cytochrome P450